MNYPLMFSSLLSIDYSEMSDSFIIFFMLLLSYCFMRPYDSPFIFTNFGNFTDLGYSLSLGGTDKRSDGFLRICGVLRLLKEGEREGSSSIASNRFGSVLRAGLAQVLTACLRRVYGSSLRWCWILFRLSNSWRQCLQFFQLSRLLLRLKQSSSYLDLYLWKALSSTSPTFYDLNFSPSMIQFCYSISTSNSSSFSSIVSRLALRTDMSLMRSLRQASTSRLEQDDLLCSFYRIVLN